MCTVVVRWAPGDPVRILALRDELVGREFDDPAAWWPELGDVVAGRDRVAGGTWCASRVDTGATALVLNRPQKRLADEGAPSRGVLPLLGVTHGVDWPSHVRLDGMASFALVLATPGSLTTWTYDGRVLTSTDDAPGVVMVTSGGAEDGKAERWLGAFRAADFPDGWRALVRRERPRPDPAALVVRHELDGGVFATVFGQLVEATPGRLRLDYTRVPARDEPWTTMTVGDVSDRPAPHRP